MTIRFLTAKCYSILFGVSKRTAERLISEDRVKLRRKRVTPRDLMEMYSLHEVDFLPLYP